jgi:ankyrin repeat protein
MRTVRCFCRILLLAAAVGADSFGSRLADLLRIGESEAALAVIRRGTDVNARDARGFTALMWASAAGDAAVVRALLEAGARVNDLRRLEVRSPRAPRAALQLAIANGHAAAFDLLVRSGAHFDFGQCSSLTPRNREISRACAGAVASGKRLLAAVRAGACDELSEDGASTGYIENRGTPLMHAARSGDLRCVRALSAASQRTRWDEVEGRGVLDWAVEANRIDVVRALLAEKPPAEVIRRIGKSPSVARSQELSAAFSELPAAATEERVPDAAPGPDLQRAVERLDHAVSQLPRRLRLRTDIERDVRWLAQRSRSQADVSDEYTAALRRAAETAERIVQGKEPPAALEDVAEELRAKVDHCRITGIGMGGTVRLLVHTRRGSEKVDNLQVFYLLKIFENTQVTPGAFPRWSSPTQEPLEPGRYWLWARDPVSRRSSDRVLVKLSGRDEITVDLPVP